MLFSTVDAFREALWEYAVKEGVNLVKIKNEKVCVTTKCVVTTYSFRVHVMT